MGVETERKFLVNQLLWNAVKKDGRIYRQGYLLRSHDKTIRLRLVEGDKGYITIKGKPKGASRAEYEYSIPRKDAEELLAHFCDAIVSKKRYRIKVQGKLWEVDEFMDDNDGLVIAEIELEDEAENFILPEWIGKEVTGEPRYYNSELSVNPYKKLERMTKKKELKYFNKLFKKMQQQFKSFAHTQNAEALHAFRVQVKKIRSFLKLLEAGHRNDKLLKTFKPVKKLFKQTGIIREAYIHQKQAKENHINAPQFYKEQEAIQQAETGKLLHHQHKHLLKMKKVKQRLRHRMQAVSQNEIGQFFSIQISKTEQVLKSHRFGEQLHNGRKMLKHLLYNRHIIPRTVAEEMNINFDDIDAMQQVIGDWHDNKLALDFFSKKLSAKDLETMQQKQEALKKNITAKAGGFAQIDLQ